MLLDSTQLSAESLARTAVILGVFVLLLFSSTTSIIIILANRNLNEVTGYYMVSVLDVIRSLPRNLLENGVVYRSSWPLNSRMITPTLFQISLATADLLWALLFVPMSVYNKLYFDGNNTLLCKSAAYLQIVILTSTLFTFGWISVDRYSAFMKPSRYESDHTLTRCKCWISFSWLTAILTALPVIVAKMEADYYHEYEFCVLNWTSAAAYSVTLAVLVLVPSLCTIIFTSAAIFSAIRKPAELEDVQRTALQTDQNFVVAMFVIIAFFLSWMPIIIIHFLPSSLLHPADTATMKFAFVWLAIGGSSSKFLIFMFVRTEFRRSFCIPCVGRENDAPDDVGSGMDVIQTHHKSCIQIFCFCLPKPRPPPRRHQRRSLQNAHNSNSYSPFPSDPIARNSFGTFNGGSHSMALTEPYTYGTIGRASSGV